MNVILSQDSGYIPEKNRLVYSLLYKHMYLLYAFPLDYKGTSEW